MIAENAYAKINLVLDVTGRRPNGYHDVRMVMQTLDLHDTLEFSENNEGIKLTTDNEELNRESEAGSDNLIVKAIHAISEYTGCSQNVTVKLTKRIPIAAGLAGGSADAAATLRGLNKLFELKLSDEELRNIGLTIGADVPFCISGGTQLSEGIGEVLTRLPKYKDMPVVICKPNVNVSTKEVYEKFDAIEDVHHPNVDAMVSAIKGKKLSEIDKLVGNVLEQVTGTMYPEIGSIEKRLKKLGAQASIMSGSGPTVFALFDNYKQALTASEILAIERPMDAVFATLTR